MFNLSKLNYRKAKFSFKKNIYNLVATFAVQMIFRPTARTNWPVQLRLH